MPSKKPNRVAKQQKSRAQMKTKTKNNTAKTNTTTPHSKTNRNKTKTPVEKEFDSFRHEIYKLGLTGLDKRDQIDARYELAIKLGAKPKSWIKPNKGLGEGEPPRVIRPK